MEQAIGAYRKISSTEEFRELERARHYAEHNRASAIGYARDEGYREAEEKWRSVVNDLRAENAEKDAEIERLREQLEK